MPREGRPSLRLLSTSRPPERVKLPQRRNRKLWGLCLVVPLMFTACGFVIIWSIKSSYLGDRDENKKLKRLTKTADTFDPEEHPLEEKCRFLTTMSSRSARVAALCSSSDDSAAGDDVLSNVVADLRESFLYCRVPLPASDSTLATLLQQQGLWQARATGATNGKTYGLLQQSDLKQHSTLYRTRFMITQHPFTRLLTVYIEYYEDGRCESCYRDRGRDMVRLFREAPPGISEHQVEALLSRVDRNREDERTLGNPYANPLGPTFTEFVRYVINESLPDDDTWRPYHRQCAPCYIEYNYVLRFEELHIEGDIFLHHVRKNPRVKKATNSDVPDSAITSDVSCSYYSQLSSSLVKQLVHKYEPDLRLYEYEAESYVNCADEYLQQEIVIVNITTLYNKNNHTLPIY